MAVDKQELARLEILPDARATYAAAVKTGGEHIKLAFELVSMVEATNPPHGEREHFIVEQIAFPAHGPAWPR